MYTVGGGEVLRFTVGEGGRKGEGGREGSEGEESYFYFVSFSLLFVLLYISLCFSLFEFLLKHKKNVK